MTTEAVNLEGKVHEKRSPTDVISDKPLPTPDRSISDRRRLPDSLGLTGVLGRKGFVKAILHEAQYLNSNEDETYSFSHMLGVKEGLETDYVIGLIGKEWIADSRRRWDRTKEGEELNDENLQSRLLTFALITKPKKESFDDYLIDLQEKVTKESGSLRTNMIKAAVHDVISRAFERGRKSEKPSIFNAFKSPLLMTDLGTSNGQDEQIINYWKELIADPTRYQQAEEQPVEQIPEGGITPLPSYTEKTVPRTTQQQPKRAA